MNNKYNESKTEFLFESDAEKAILKETEMKLQVQKHKKLKMKIYLNTCILTFAIFIISIFTFKGINNNQKKLQASLINETKKLDLTETLNESSKTLKKVTNNYDNKYEILINKANPICEDYVNVYKIIPIENNLFNNIFLEEQTYNNYLKLKENLLSRGYYINIRSGFRTFDESIGIYKEYESQYGKNYANKYVAAPGTSEHNAGLAIDFVVSKDKYAYHTNYESEEYNYLLNIAYLYGFILRYPKDKENITGYSYEPWHLRYVGIDLAKYLSKNNLTLEEYYN